MRFEFSAGGVVYKHEEPRNGTRRTTKVLVAQHSQHHGWVFPKGLIDKKELGIRNPSARLRTSQESGIIKETKEEAALREVKEETGIVGKIIKPLTAVTYWYNFEGEKIKKTVYYFLMEYASGDTKHHDFEMENVEWLPMDNVENRLTYKSDKEMWKEARTVIPNLFRDLKLKDSESSSE